MFSAMLPHITLTAGFQVREPSGSSILIASGRFVMSWRSLSAANSRLAAMLMSGEESPTKQRFRCLIKLQLINILIPLGPLMLLGSGILGVCKVVVMKQSCLQYKRLQRCVNNVYLDFAFSFLLLISCTRLEIFSAYYFSVLPAVTSLIVVSD